MNINNTKTRRVAASVAGLILLFCMSHPMLPSLKARPQRIQAVNHLAYPFPRSALTTLVVTNRFYLLLSR